MNENNHDENVKESKRLALKLKDLCNDKGIEIDLVASSEIIHKLGLLYSQRSFNKISLIQSVGLLNSAIARNPKNMSIIKRDLSQVCRFILEQAKAQNSTADLIEKATEVKNDVDLMRNEVNRRLTISKTIQNFEILNCETSIDQQKAKIKSIKKIQLHITDNYKKLMTDLSQYCEHVMGPPPCKFAVVGMGSLARKEITPYSDFEHIILLENNICDENFLEYFRWFTVIFHVIVLNLQETIIPSFNIEYLNDKAGELGDWFFDTCTSGISFDGMMVHACKFPLGRTQPTKHKPWTTELIKPVKEMLEYLSNDLSLKEGYHLSDILTGTCFVYGDQALHDEFEKGMKSHNASKTRDELFDEIRKRIKDDLDNFAARTKLVSLKPNDNLNVKQMFYRTSTLFISALGRICEAKSLSCFDIINELAEQQKISENTKHKLSYAVAIACEIRLCVYMKAQSQRDYIQSNETSQTIFDEILEFISAESIVNYFQIAYCLQREIIEELEIKKTHIYSNHSLMNITICYALKLNGPMLALLKKKQTFSNDADLEQRSIVVKNNFFTCFDKYLADMEIEMQNSAIKLIGTRSYVYSIVNASNDAWLDDDFGNLDEQNELLMRVVEILQRSSLSDDDRKKMIESENMDIDSLIGEIQLATAFCLIVVNKFDEASMQMNQAFKNFDQTNNSPDKVIEFYFFAGNNFFAMKNYEKSLTCLQIALGINLSANTIQFGDSDDSEIAMMYSGIGICLLKLNQYEESLIYLKIAIQMIEVIGFEKLDSGVSLFIDPTSTYHNLGKCCMRLGHFEQALACFFQALELTKNENADKENDVIFTQPTFQAFIENQRLQNRADIFHDLGLLHKNIMKFKEAAIYFQKSFDDCNKLPHHKHVDETRLELLKCYMEIYQRERVD